MSWSMPASSGSSAITDYVVTSAPGNLMATTNGALTANVTGLTNGTSYTFTVKASNAAGIGPASLPSNAVTPATVPTAPQTPSAMGAPGSATVSWAAPASNGGSAITSYTVSASPGGVVATTPGALTANVSGLLNGTSYTFTVTATNALGTGPASAPTTPVTPATTPGAPAAPSVVRGDGQATVSWAPPVSNGGAPITSYQVVTAPGGGGPTTSGLSAVVQGLLNGNTYSFAVRATNAVGPGQLSPSSAAVTPATVPSAPSAPSATPGNGQAQLGWNPPFSNGGESILGYIVTTNPGGATTAATTTTVTVAGLSNGTSYSFVVRAYNAVGTGPNSGNSNPVVPVTVPGQPLAPIAMVVGFDQVQLTWTPPPNGGSPITGFTIHSMPPAAPVSVGQFATSTTLFNLTATDYTFTVTATNALGSGPPSPPSNHVFP